MQERDEKDERGTKIWGGGTHKYEGKK